MLNFTSRQPRTNASSAGKIILSSEKKKHKSKILPYSDRGQQKPRFFTPPNRHPRADERAASRCKSDLAGPPLRPSQRSAGRKKRGPLRTECTPRGWQPQPTAGRYRQPDPFQRHRSRWRPEPAAGRLVVQTFHITSRNALSFTYWCSPPVLSPRAEKKSAGVAGL